MHAMNSNGTVMYSNYTCAFLIDQSYIWSNHVTLVKQLFSIGVLLRVKIIVIALQQNFSMLLRSMQILTHFREL